RPRAAGAARARPCLRRPLPAAGGRATGAAARAGLGRAGPRLPRRGGPHPGRRAVTTTWQATPPGADWREVDGLVALVEDLVATEARPGGVHQVRWEPGRSTRVAYDRPDGEVVVVEVGTDGMTRSTLAEDRALPGVRTVLDPDEAARRFAMLLGGPPGGCRSEVVSYRPGSRCVIRCTLREGAGSRTYFVKVLADGFDEYVE